MTSEAEYNIMQKLLKEGKIGKLYAKKKIYKIGPLQMVHRE